MYGKTIRIRTLKLIMILFKLELALFQGTLKKFCVSDTDKLNNSFTFHDKLMATVIKLFVLTG